MSEEGAFARRMPFSGNFEVNVPSAFMYCCERSSARTLIAPLPQIPHGSLFAIV
jgi:hypothetical protein